MPQLPKRSLLLALFVLPLTLHAASPTNAVDLSKKAKGVGDGLKQFVVEGEKVFLIDSLGVKRRLNKPRASDPRAANKKSRERHAAALRGIAPEKILADDPVLNPDSSNPDIDDVALPKKVREFKDYYDPRTKLTGDAPPKSVDRSSKQSPVRDQGSRGLCSAFASTAAIERSADVTLSVEYAYWLYLDKSRKDVCDDLGATAAHIDTAIADSGIPAENQWAYSSFACPNKDAPAQAKKLALFRPKHSYLLEWDFGIRDFDRRTLSAAVNDPRFLEAVLASGYEVVFGYLVPQQPGYADELGRGDIVDVKADENGHAYATAGGHFMLAVGYERNGDTKIGGGYFIFKNSYGTTSGKGGYAKLSYDFVRMFGDDGVIFTGGTRVPIGGACSESNQCTGFDGSAKGTTCCDVKADVGGICQKPLKDHAGAYYCASQCVGRAGASLGTCGKDGLKDDGEECKVNADCQEFDGLGKKGSACCKGKCETLLKDFAKTYYCPHECKSAVDAFPGSCSDTSGKACKENKDCSGFNGVGKEGDACCNGHCQPMRKDFEGKYQCAQQCRGVSGASAGTCPLRKKGQSCGANVDCADGRSCCSGKCKSKKEDWAGVEYCPEECVGRFGGKPGTCN